MSLIAAALFFVFLLLPELALVGFLLSSAVLASPAGSSRDVDLVVVLGGSTERYHQLIKRGS